jgi:hypothetical protein
MNGSQVSPKVAPAKAETGGYLTTNSGLASAAGRLESALGSAEGLSDDEAIRRLDVLVVLHLAQADGLQDAVRELLAPRLPARAQLVAVDIGQPAARIAACATPRPYLVHPEQSVIGRAAVGVRCLDEVAGYLQVSVRVVGDYVVSRQRIAAGEVIKASMLELKRGPLERLPKAACSSLRRSSAARPAAPSAEAW